MRIKILRVCLSLLILAGVFSSNIWAQPLAVPETNPTKPTVVGESLLMESEDCRDFFLDIATLNSRIKRGVVAVFESGSYVIGRPNEYSTNQWVTVSDALKDLKLLDRVKRRPQIRVIQKDAILQSSILFGNTLTGFEPAFLERRLNAGDLIVIAMVH